MLHFNLMPVMVLALLGSTQCSHPPDEYEIYTQLEEALIKDSVNLFVLAHTFYPNIGSQPICVPVKYYLDCDKHLYSNISYSDSSYSDSSYSNISYSDSSYSNISYSNISYSNDSYSNISYSNIPCSESFLWTSFQSTTGLLLGYARSGVALRGFGWEKACSVRNPIELHLHSLYLTEDESSSILHVLMEITAVLKGYAKAQGGKLGLGASDTKGYAIRWNEDHQSRRFQASSGILTAVIVLLNFFIVFLSIALANYFYNTIYDNVKGQSGPDWDPVGYPIFWSVVFLSICWNVAPSWLVLGKGYGFRLYSFAVVVPLDLLIAILVKKKPDFPVPLPYRVGCRIHKDKHSSIDPAVLKCCSCLLNHSYQVVAIWSLLVLLMFLAHYFIAWIVAFYLSPVQTLIKVVFLKAVAVCAVINIALVISVTRFTLPTSAEACRNNFISAVKVVVALMFLPILAYIFLIIGGIVFSDSSNDSGLQGLLTILPTAFIVVAGWFGKERLFPAGSNETDAEMEILDSLIEPSHKDPDSASTVAAVPRTRSTPSNGPPSVELSTYNSVSPHSTNETKPLLNKPTIP